MIVLISMIMIIMMRVMSMLTTMVRLMVMTVTVFLATIEHASFSKTHSDIVQILTVLRSGHSQIEAAPRLWIAPWQQGRKGVKAFRGCSGGHAVAVPRPFS